MANFNPKTDHLSVYQLKGDRPLGKVLSVRFPEEVDQVLRAMSDRQSYIRQAVEKNLKTDGLLCPESD